MQFLDDEANDNVRPQADAPVFRLSAKNLFLTYPHCGVELQAVQQILLEALGRGNVEYMVCARERHADGDLHVHVAVCLITRCNIRRHDLLDLGEHHGNYQGMRNVRATIRYVKKDNEYIEYGTCPPRYADEADRRIILEELMKKTSEAEAMEFLFVHGHSRDSYILMNYWKTKQGESTAGSRFNLNSFLVCRPLQGLLEGLNESDQALMLIGQSGWGKTQYLMAYYSDQKILRATHMDDLKRVNALTKILIMDDMTFGHLPRTTLLYLFDVRTERSIHVRYSVANLKHDLNVIVVGNEVELVLGSHVEDVAVMRRLNIFHLPHKLWD